MDPLADNARTPSRSRPARKKFEGRFDIINVADEVYKLRDGTGVGVGAPQFGARWAYYVGLTKFFEDAVSERGGTSTHSEGGRGETVAGHERRTWGVVGLATAAAAAELVGGGRTGSAALTAEGLHMGAHVSAFAMAGLAYALGRGSERAGRPRLAMPAPDAAALLNGLLCSSAGARRLRRRAYGR